MLNFIAKAEPLLAEKDHGGAAVYCGGAFAYGEEL